ncbi:cell division protein PerM [Nocardioides bruguierae]|uniref:DUF6350 family protein n=1 Tax=Nocardioides bruguierae TaxID=2945102 RepID=A0A9X2D8E4_9ACTN|nr:DUF6350 family protein [Nocardioides bruguierae]MCM0621240.1 DUF6350 family protein [Nocardioides bruguierae]
MTPPETSTLSSRTQRRPSGAAARGRGASSHPGRPGRGGRGGRPARQRPLPLVAGVAGVRAAGLSLVVCLVLGLLGWFLADAGLHGAPRDALRVGALGWLMGHGSGVQVENTPVTLVPLAVTLLAAWATWRRAVRAGEALAGHGPDADRLADGERDWTVAVASGCFTLGYLLVALVTDTVAATADTDPDTGRVVLVSLVLSLGIGLPGLAVGSGRAAVLAARLPDSVRGLVGVTRRVLGLWLGLCTAVVLLAVATDFSTFANILSQLHVDAGDVTAYLVVCLLLLPNAALWASAYLLGPGFVVGTGTVVSPAAVVLGALPMFPLLAALPDAGTPGAWQGGLLVLAPLVAGAGAALAQRRDPVPGVVDATLRGALGSVLAGLLLGLVTALSGGAAGPGRMAEVGPSAVDVLAHAVPALALGGAVGALVTLLLQRRRG